MMVIRRPSHKIRYINRQPPSRHMRNYAIFNHFEDYFINLDYPSLATTTTTSDNLIGFTICL
jgi:hypothetical protein